MHEIIDRKFDEWTRNVDPEERKIQIFEHIRDIPYVITGITDPENGPVELLRRNEGTCSPKHFLLGAITKNWIFLLNMHRTPSGGVIWAWTILESSEN